MNKTFGDLVKENKKKSHLELVNESFLNEIILN
jgi:hypothetical protein